MRGLVVHDGEVLSTSGQWKQLVTRARWEQVCAAITDRSLFAGLPRRRSMLTGILVCGVCSMPMVRSSGAKPKATVQDPKPKGVKLWRCHAGPRRDGCGKVSVRAELIEPRVVEATMQHVDTLDLAALLTKSSAPGHANTARELAALDKREADMGASAAGGKVNMRTVEAFTKSIEAQRVALRTRLMREVKRDALAPFAGKVGALRATWRSLSVDQQRAIIAESLRAVTVLPGKPGNTFDPSRIVIGATKAIRRKS